MSSDGGFPISTRTHRKIGGPAACGSAIRSSISWMSSMVIWTLRGLEITSGPGLLSLISRRTPTSPGRSLPSSWRATPSCALGQPFSARSIAPPLWLQNRQRCCSCFQVAAWCWALARDGRKMNRSPMDTTSNATRPASISLRRRPRSSARCGPRIHHPSRASTTPLKTRTASQGRIRCHLSSLAASGPSAP